MSFYLQWTKDGRDIPGETANTYVVRPGDKGHTIFFRVIAGNTAGLSSPATSPGVYIPADGPALAISGTPTASTTVGTPYSFVPTASGGTPPYTFSMPSGTLPTGLTFNPLTGGISGTPTTAQVQSGLVIKVTDQLGATASLPAFSITVIAIPSTNLRPSSQWNGTAGSGYGGAFSPIPTPVTRTTAQPWLLPLFVPWMTVTGDVVVGFESGAGAATGIANGGVAKVRIYLEGNYVDLTQETSYTFTDINGVSQTLPAGYFTTLDYASWIALSSSGEALMYAVAYPVDTSMQVQTVGPFSFYARTTEFSVTKTVGASGADFTTIKAALTYARTNPTQRVRVQLIDNASYKIDAQDSTFTGAKWWTVIEAAPGKTCYIGDGTLSTTQPGFDGLCFRGLGIKWDNAKLGYTLSAYRFSNGTTNRLWLNGIDGPYCGAADAGHGGSGSGAAALINGNQPSIFWITGNDATTAWNVYFTYLAAHDLPGYGLSFYRARINCTTDNVSGSDCENGYLTYGGYSSRIGGYYSGLRTEQGAFDLTGPVGSAYEKTGANGSTGAFNVYDVAAGSITHSFPISTGNETMASLISAINGWAGWTATPTTTTNQLSAAYLSRADLVPSAAIPKTNLVGTAHLTRIADIHADVDVHHTYLWQNGATRFFENRKSVGTAFISVNGDQPMRDWGYRNMSNSDISNTVGEATQPGYWGGARSHVVVQYGSNTNPSGWRFLSGSTSDVYCDVDHCASPLTIAAGSLANQKITSLAAPVLPTGSDSNSKVVSTNQGLLFTTPFSDPPNFTPLAPLTLPNATIAGRLTAAGRQQGT